MVQTSSYHVSRLKYYLLVFFRISTKNKVFFVHYFFTTFTEDWILSEQKTTTTKDEIANIENPRGTEIKEKYYKNKMKKTCIIWNKIMLTCHHHSTKKKEE